MIGRRGREIRDNEVKEGIEIEGIVGRNRVRIRIGRKIRL